jgi:hypothetical protein
MSTWHWAMSKWTSYGLTSSGVCIPLWQPCPLRRLELYIAHSQSPNLLPTTMTFYENTQFNYLFIWILRIKFEGMVFVPTQKYCSLYFSFNLWFLAYFNDVNSSVYGRWVCKCILWPMCSIFFTEVHFFFKWWMENVYSLGKWKPKKWGKLMKASQTRYRTLFYSVFFFFFYSTGVWAWGLLWPLELYTPVLLSFSLLFRSCPAFATAASHCDPPISISASWVAGITGCSTMPNPYSLFEDFPL